jgi:hypothetical protein
VSEELRSVPPAVIADVLSRPWYVVRDTLIDGWAVGTADAPTHKLEAAEGECVVLDLTPKPVAEHVTALHNAALASRAAHPSGG